jgi:hypothetical protein
MESIPAEKASFFRVALCPFLSRLVWLLAWLPAWLLVWLLALLLVWLAPVDDALHTANAVPWALLTILA